MPRRLGRKAYLKKLNDLWVRGTPQYIQKKSRKTARRSHGKSQNFEKRTPKAYVRSYNAHGNAGTPKECQYDPYYAPHLFFQGTQQRGLRLLCERPVHINIVIPHHVQQQVEQLSALTRIQKSTIYRDAIVWYCSLLEAKVTEV